MADGSHHRIRLARARLRRSAPRSGDSRCPTTEGHSPAADRGAATLRSTARLLIATGDLAGARLRLVYRDDTMFHDIAAVATQLALAAPDIPLARSRPGRVAGALGVPGAVAARLLVRGRRLRRRKTSMVVSDAWAISRRGRSRKVTSACSSTPDQTRADCSTPRPVTNPTATSPMCCEPNGPLRSGTRVRPKAGPL